MIPKIVHYCWFGGKEKPKSVIRFIEEWKKILVGYTFIEWNEENFPIDYNHYTKEAYDMKKYAFVSDVARVYALSKYGGIYLDTDIEIKKDFTTLLDEYKGILGYENGGEHLMTAFLAFEANNWLITELLHEYDQLHFCKEGVVDTTPNTTRLSNILKEFVNLDGEFQVYRDIALFPEVYFSAMRFENKQEMSDQRTYTVHHFDSTWLPFYVRIRRKIKIYLLTVFGKR